MKKIAMLLALILMLALPAMADSAEPVLLEGVILEISEDGYLVCTEESGNVMVHVGEETILETSAEPAAGDYVYIDYNGMMTYSLPAQITALTLRMYRLEGDVVEWDAEANTVLVNSSEWGDVLVRLPEEWKDAELTEDHLTAYFNGAMTMSLPAQIGAGLVIPGYSVQGVVTEATDEFILLGEDMSAVQVNLSGLPLPEGVETGAAVRVFFDGQMTRSIPAQITADSIERIGADAPAAE